MQGQSRNAEHEAVKIEYILLYNFLLLTASMLMNM